MRIITAIVVGMTVFSTTSSTRSEDAGSPVDSQRARVTTAPVISSRRGNVDLNVLDAQIRHAVKVNPELHGAWMDVDRDDQDDPGVAPGRFKFHKRFTDSRNHVRQIAIFEQLIQSWVPDGNYWIDASEDQVLPFSELMGALRQETADDYSLRGCWIEGGYYKKSSDDALNLVLMGRVKNEKQSEIIERSCVSLMRPHPSWVLNKPTTNVSVDKPTTNVSVDKPTTDPSVDIPLSLVALRFAPSSTDLKQVPGSAGLAIDYFESGTKAFHRNDFARARDEFQMATVENPDEHIYRYWLALTHLGLCDESRAKKNIVTAIRINAGATYPAAGVHYSMRRVQGPLRLQLLDLYRVAATRAAYVSAP